MFIISLWYSAARERKLVDGSTPTKIAASKSEKRNLLGCLKRLLARLKQFYKFR